MKLVLLSGGSGKRLWPLSSGSYAKQFLPVFHDDHGSIETMVQRSLRQIASAGLLEKTYLCTVQEQVAILLEQAPHIQKNLIVEPSSRDTFAAMSLATCFLLHHGLIQPDEVVAFCAVDLYVATSFYQAIYEAAELVKDNKIDLAMIGIKPFFPSDKYGYIIPKNSDADALVVDTFIEKPSIEKAAILIKEGALWNSSFYAFRAQFLVDYLFFKGMPTDFNKLHNYYPKLPKKSFDYEVTQQVKAAKVLTYNGHWSDVGSWDALIEVVNEKFFGNGLVSNNCKNVYVINQLPIPINVDDQHDLVIVASPFGILIAAKELVHTIKGYVTQIEKQHNIMNLKLIQNCHNVEVENRCGVPLLVLGVSNAKIVCKEEIIIIKAV